MKKVVLVVSLIVAGALLCIGLQQLLLKGGDKGQEVKSSMESSVGSRAEKPPVATQTLKFDGRSAKESGTGNSTKKTGSVRLTIKL